MKEEKKTENALKLEATVDNLPRALEFVDEHLEGSGCSFKTQNEIEIAVEEIFVNIASYAYHPETGEVEIRFELSDDPETAVIILRDQGVEYDPLKKEDPDLTLPAEERGIGGLGIFMTGQLMDELEYEYKDGSNILTMKKKLK